jgi:hypothetical protein
MNQHAGATGVNLMLQFIGAITTHTETSVWVEVDMFVQETCHILEMNSGASATNTSGQRHRITMEILQLLVRFMIDHSSKIGGTAHGTRETLRQQRRLDFASREVPSALTDEMDDFIDDLFALIASTQLKCDMLVLVWTLLQVSECIPLFHCR